MSTTLEEEHQRFTFDDQWVVFKYDSATPDTGYFSIKNAVEGTKACDFLGEYAGATAYFIEVKDFRGFRIQNKKRLSRGELAAEIAQKVRDTLAGVLSGCRRGDDTFRWDQLAIYLTRSERELLVVLCLEHDDMKDKVRLGAQAELVRQKLAWLKPKVRVVSHSIKSHKLPGVVVTDLPGAAGHA